MFQLLFFTWLAQAAPVLLLFLPAWFYRREYLRIYWSDYCLIFLPWLLWILAGLTNFKVQTLSNAIVESMLLGVGLALFGVARVFLAKKFDQQTLSKNVLLAGLLLSLTIYGFIPTLPV